MNVFPADRIQTADAWIRAIDPARRLEAALADVTRDQSLELSITRLVAETKVEAMIPLSPPAIEVPPPQPRVLEYIGFDNDPALPPDQSATLATSGTEIVADRPVTWPGRMLRAAIAAVVMGAGGSLIVPLGQEALRLYFLEQAVN